MKSKTITLLLIMIILLYALVPAFQVSALPVRDIGEALSVLSPATDIKCMAKIEDSYASSGLRFLTSVNTEAYEAFMKAYPNARITAGTLICPAAYVTEAGAFTREALDGLEKKSAKYLDVIASDRSFTTQDRGVFSGSVVAIKFANFKLAFAAIGYLEATLDGNKYVVYSKTYSVRSVYDIATAATADTSDDLTEGYTNLLSNGKYSPYKQKQYDILKIYSTDITNDALWGRRILCIGDSITSGTSLCDPAAITDEELAASVPTGVRGMSYVYYLENLGASFGGIINAGTSGSVLSTGRNTAKIPIPSKIDGRDGSGKSTSMLCVNNLKSKYPDDFFAITVMFGVNEFTRSYVLGEPSSLDADIIVDKLHDYKVINLTYETHTDNNDQTSPPCYMDGNGNIVGTYDDKTGTWNGIYTTTIDDVNKTIYIDTDTIYGAWEYTAIRLMKDYSYSKLIFITPPTFRGKILNFTPTGENDGGYTFSEIADAIKYIASKYGITVTDNYYASGITQETASVYLGDNCHPNYKGAILLAKNLLNTLMYEAASDGLKDRSELYSALQKRNIKTGAIVPAFANETEEGLQVYLTSASEEVFFNIPLKVGSLVRLTLNNNTATGSIAFGFEEAPNDNLSHKGWINCGSDTILGPFIPTTHFWMSETNYCYLCRSEGGTRTYKSINPALSVNLNNVELVIKVIDGGMEIFKDDILIYTISAEKSNPYLTHNTDTVYFSMSGSGSYGALISEIKQ